MKSQEITKMICGIHPLTPRNTFTKPHDNPSDSVRDNFTQVSGIFSYSIGGNKTKRLSKCQVGRQQKDKYA